jgi:hypothetical protein
MRPVQVASAARECFKTHLTYAHPLEWRKTFVCNVKFAHTAKFGEQHAETRFVGVTREDIIWWKIWSRSEINTELQSPPPCLHCQLYVLYILTIITASVLQQMGFRSVFLQYTSDKETGKLLNDVPKNNVSPQNLIIIKILITEVV